MIFNFHSESRLAVETAIQLSKRRETKWEDLSYNGNKRIRTWSEDIKRRKE